MLLEGNWLLEEFLPVYSWWTSILVIFMMTLTWFTGRIRVRTQTIHSKEDRMWLDDKSVILHPNGGGHEEVDRIRSAHLSDLKTIMPYLLIVPIWLTTSPSYFATSIILRLFPICKIADTVLYMKLIKSPNIIPAILLTVCYVILIYIGTSIIVHCLCL